jgi:hypothetical protein
MNAVPPSVNSEVLQRCRRQLALAARDKLDCGIAKPNVNLCCAEPSTTRESSASRLLPLAGLLACQLARAGPAHAVAGDLDPSFGPGGKVTTDVAGGGDGARALAVQADGRPAVAGDANIGQPTGADFGVARYRAR